MFPRASRWGPPLLIFAVAWGFRLFYLGGIEAYPKFELIKNRLDDQVVFDAWATAILRGQGFDYSATGHEFAYWAEKSPGVFPQSPLYPYLLAGLYHLVGQDYDRIRLFQGLCGALTCLLVFALARRFLRPWWAMLAGLGGALYGPWIFYESTFLRAGLLTPLVALGLWLLLIASDRRAGVFDFAAGACLALGVLMRPNLLVFSVFAIAWLAWSRRGKGRPWTAAGWATLGLILPLVPVVVANNSGDGAAAFLSSNGPYIFFVGNVHDSTGTSAGPSPYYFAVKARDGDPAPVNLLTEALADIRRHPVAYLRLLVGKLRAFFSSREIPNNLSYEMAKRENVRLLWAVEEWHWILPWALLGMAIGLRQWRRWLLLYLFLGAYAGGTVFFYVLGRLRQPAVVALLIFAALGWQWTADLWRRKKWAPALVVILLAVIGSALGSPRPRLRETDYQMAAAARYSLGEQMEQQEKRSRARDEYARAVALNPQHRTALARLSELDVVSAGPLSREVEDMLANSRRLARSDPEAAIELLHRAAILAPGASEPHHFLANVYFLEGDHEAAMASLERALFLDPLQPLIRRNLLALRRRHRDGDQ